jgi:hypothetical protein
LLIWSVSVIDYCDLGFICNLVLGIWNLEHVGWPLLFFLPPAARSACLTPET